MNDHELTVEQLDAMPRRSTVWDVAGDAWQKGLTSWRCSAVPNPGLDANSLIDAYGPIRSTDPLAPEPDHSMCARLVEDGTFPDGARKWVLQHPNGEGIFSYDDYDARDRGYTIPELSVVEQAATVMSRIDGHAIYAEIAQALADAGLLVSDDDD